MKKYRQEKIKEIIAFKTISSQDELLMELSKYGICTTQATLSRDMRDLHIKKDKTLRGDIGYTIPSICSIQLNNSLISSIIDIKYALNIVVLKTNPGLAQAVAVGIDDIHDDSILGCVGGDDTIIIVTDSENTAANVKDILLSYKRSE